MPEEMQPEVDPVEDGQVTEAGEGEVSEPLPEPSYFDPTPYADQLARVKVDGEEIEVPVSELVSGYSRTADYTRKQQALAAQRQELTFASAIAEALQHNPEQAIRDLSAHYLGGQAQGGDEDDEFLDPLEREVREMRGAVNEFQQYQATQRLERDIAEGQQMWGDLVDPREAVSYAYSRGWTGPTAVKDAFAAVAGQALLSQRAAENTLAAQRAAANTQVVSAKRDAQIVEGGAGTAGRAIAQGTPAVSSVRDAYLAAVSEHGVR